MYLSHLGCLCFSPAVSAVSFQACIGHKVCSHLKLPTTVPIQPPRVVGSVTDVYSTLVFVTVRINPQYFCPGEHFRKKRWLKPFWGCSLPLLGVLCHFSLVVSSYSKVTHKILCTCTHTHFSWNTACQQGYLSILGLGLHLKFL